MLAFSIDYYGMIFRATQSVELFCAYGLWQVSGRSDITDFEEVVRLDTEYISNWRLASDLKILIKTVGVVLARKGSK